MGKLREVREVRGKLRDKCPKFKLEDYCLLTSRTTVGSDNFFNFNKFPHLRNLNTVVLENSVDLDSIAGTYCGVLPPNVETILTLNADGTYRLKRKSANESDSCEVLNGIFKVIDGSILMLEHPSSSDNIFYKVKNDSGIILIDSFGNEPKARDSKLYILKK